MFFNRLFISSIFLATLVISSCSNSTENNYTSMAKQIELRDFFKNPEKTNFKISPNGAYYSYLAPYESRMNLFVQQVGSEEALRITDVTDRDIAGYLWAAENRILYMKDNGGDENFALYGVDLDGSNHQPLTAFDGVMTQIIDELEGLEDFILVALNKRDQRIFDPYRLNIRTGNLEMLYENPGNISSWLTDHEGKLRIATTTDGVNTGILYRDTEKDKFETLITTSFKESLSPMFFTFDNKNLYALSNLNRDKSALVIFDVKQGKEVEMLLEHPEVDLENAGYSKLRKKLTTASYTTHKHFRHFFDEATAELYLKIESGLEGKDFGVTSTTKDETQFLIRTYSDKSRGAYYHYNAPENRLTKLVEISPWLDENEMAEMTPISYTTQDGFTIQGYLTLPKGVEPKNLPVVINPHGGPWARDEWGFNPEVQFLANRGYAVLQMNFRGSTGYGRKFWEASFKQWGQAMQNDISEGVAWLISEGIADPNRVAIYGASYGGYATLAGLTFTPELYACGIDYVGVSNLFTFMQTIPPYWENYLSMLHEMVGHPKNDSLMMAQYSPSLHANRIKVPIFIAQGANDPRVKKSESDQMVEALQKQGIDVEYMVKTNEGHGFRNEENQFDFYLAMERFLLKHLMNRKVEEVEITS